MNLLLISLDTTRADRLSCYGHFRPTSPHLDRIASEGALFTQFYSPHIPTFPGHTTMMTGRDVYAHQITGQSSVPELSPEIPTLAEILSSQGWYTAAADNLGRWFKGGFQQYEGYDWDKTAKDAWRKGEAVLEASLRAIDGAASQDRPFFLFLHFWDPHTPYLPPAPFSRMFYEGDERNPANRSMDSVWSFENFKWYFHEWMPGVTDIEFPKAQYDAEIAYMDACLAHVFERLRHHRLLDETLISITADHGEELDEHGCWFDHHGLYEPNVRIPFILRLHGVIPSGAQVQGFARTTDITPTLLDFAGLLDPSLHFEGTSLRPMLDQCKIHNPESKIEALFLTENTWMKKRAIRTETHKLIVSLEPDLHGFPPVELYDLSADPGETRNLADERTEKVHELRSLLEQHVAERTAATGHPDPLPIQPLPLRRIGKMETAVPRDMEPADEKREEGDFVGYERDENAVPTRRIAESPPAARSSDPSSE